MDSCKQEIKIALGLKHKFLNLGCGTLIIPQWTNVDLYQHEGVDMVVDLNKPWPWEDGSIQQIFATHVIEHVDDCIHFMKEAHRVLQPGGYLRVHVPYGWHDAGLGDPTHVRPFYPWTFYAFAKDHGIENTRSLQAEKSRWNFTWEIVELKLNVENWLKRIPFWRHWAIPLAKYLNNIATEIQVIYKKPDLKQ